MDFAPRKLLDVKRSTPPNVGPTTYMVTYPCCKYSKTNAVPFLSSSKRKSINTVLYTDKLYNPAPIRSNIKYGNSLQFTAPRVTIDINEEPPPREEFRSRPYCMNPRKKANTGRLFVCRVPFSKGISVPSIPGHKDVNGYYLTDDNDLVKIPPTDHDSSLGPAFYSVPMGELNFNSKRYAGCTWSKMKGQRSKLTTNDNPGPGEYEVKFITCGRHKEDEKFKELMRKCCNVPRYTCLMSCQAIKDGYPGPGYYETVNMDTLGKPKYLSLKRRPFITTPERFIYKPTIGPGPQRYFVCDCYKHKKDFKLNNVPFLSETKRFSNKPPDINLSPGQYEITEVKCVRYKAEKQVPFNSTEERKLLEIRNTNPGPGTHEIPMKGVRCCPQEIERRSYVFSSMCCRFRRRKPEEQPEPASYITTKAFKYVKDKHFHRTGKCVPFGMSEPKFARMYHFAGIQKAMDSPSVGLYTLPNLSKSQGKSFCTAARFVHKTEKRPGPTTYTLHPQVGESMYRPKTTHSVRLMKDIIKRVTTQLSYNIPEKPKTPRERRKSEWLTIEECPFVPEKK